MTEDPIIIERPEVDEEDGVATVWINRPERRNAVDNDAIDRLGAAIAEVGADERISAVLLRGRGGRFGAGADVGDLSSMLSATDAELVATFDGHLATLNAWRTAPVVTVAVLEGIALGFAVALAAVCDRVVARPDTRIALPEVRLGMAPAMVIDAILDRMSGSAAMYLATTGTEIDAVTARNLGLVDVVVPAHVAETPEVLETWLRQDLAAAGGGRVAAVRQTVAMIRARRQGDPGDAADQSVRALRSPEVAAILGGSRKA